MSSPVEVADLTKKHCSEHPACKDCPLVASVCVAPSGARWGDEKWNDFISRVNAEVKAIRTGKSA